MGSLIWLFSFLIVQLLIIKHGFETTAKQGEVYAHVLVDTIEKTTTVEESKAGTVMMPAQQLEATFSSKRELYNFLIYDMGLLLPKIDSTNAHFYKEIISGKKKVWHS